MKINYVREFTVRSQCNLLYDVTTNHKLWSESLNLVFAESFLPFVCINTP